MQRLHILILVVLVSGLPFSLWSQQFVFAPGDIEDPAVFEMGQVFPHSFHIPFETREAATKSDPAASPYFLSLNGSWKFKWVHRPELAPGNFQLYRFNDRQWNEIEVPSNWQMQGYGDPKFRNIALSFESDPPNIPDYYNPTGCYRKEFRIPRNWRQRDIFMRFEGIKSASYVWVNGHPVGYNQGGFEPAEYNITSYLKRGKNVIAVKVIRFCDGSYLENQDMWRLSGIFRDVLLYAMPQVRISDHYYYTEFDDACRTANLHTIIQLTNASGKFAENYALEVDVLDDSRGSILGNPIRREGLNIAPGVPLDVKVSAEAVEPDQWSAEHPHLYKILYTLYNQDGDLVETFSANIGFREVEIRDEMLLVNGKPVKLNGVNSHMHHPDHGQAVPINTLREDLLIMKRNNINCVRTSHYPPSPAYVHLADSLGIYLINEVGDEAHQHIELSYDSSYTEMYRDRSRKLVYRDRNHASVIMWSAGNESGSGPNIDEVITTGKEIDPSRPAWMYGGNTFYIPYEDITGPRYWTPYQLKNLAEHRILGEDDLRPAFMDEYLAATGNGLGGLDEYWELIRRYPKITGGAIWDWISPGITVPLWSTPDHSAKSNHGIILGRPEFVEGRSGRALSFSGHDQWVEFYRDPSLDVCGDRLVISFWVNPGMIPQPNNFIMKGDHQYGIRMDSPGSIEFYIQQNNLGDIHQSPYYNNTSSRISASGRIPGDWFGNWHHVAGIYDGKAISVFVDQEMVANEKASGKIAHSPFPLCIGRDSENQDQGEYSGRLSSMVIDDVQISDTVYSIGELYDGISPGEALLSMHFETDSVGGEFYSTGLGGRTYGIVWPDRSIQPELHQVRKSAQPIEIIGVNVPMGEFMVINHHHFTDLADFDVAWSFLMDGELAEEGSIKVNCLPGDSTTVQVPFAKLKTPGELILTISFRSREKKNRAEQGHEVAWEQFVIQDSYRAKNSSQGKEIELLTEDNAYVITCNAVQYRLSRQTGSFESVISGDTLLIESGPSFNIWRAPLANDVDPWGAYKYSDSKMMAGLGRSIDNQLRTLGMREFNTEVVGSKSTSLDGYIQIKLHKYHHSTNLRGAFECREEYRFFPDGTVEIDFHLVPHGVMPDILPKVGWQFRLPPEFRDVSWYGRGPWESYPDRKTGSKIGVYHSNADREYVPYLMPQDYGNHTDIRWVHVGNGAGTGLRFSSDDLMNFSLHKYTTDNLSRAMYQHQLKDAPYITLNIDYEVSGVGGTAVRQLEKYRVKPKEAVYHLRIDPIKP